MNIDKVKFFIMCAKHKKNKSDVIADAGLSSMVMKNINAGRASTAATVGKLAEVLQCQPEELLKL